MALVFISYSRRDQGAVQSLLDDLDSLGHEPWLDRELSGGQRWWDQILTNIQACEVFALALTPESVRSVACERELEWALALRKPILPILAADLSLNLLPSALATLQLIDCRQATRGSALQLARALGQLRQQPLPDPLPSPPEAPLSYLVGLHERIGVSEQLDFDTQASLLVSIKAALRNAEESKDAWLILQRFRTRRDLLATIADEIDELLVRATKPLEVVVAPHAEPTAAPDASTVDAPPRRSNRRAAIINGLVATVVGALSMTTVQPWEPAMLLLGLIPGLGGLGAGFIAGPLWSRMTLVWAGGIIAWTVVAIGVHDDDSFSIGGIFGLPLGLLLGSALAIVLARWFVPEAKPKERLYSA